MALSPFQMTYNHDVSGLSIFQKIIECSQECTYHVYHVGPKSILRSDDPLAFICMVYGWVKYSW